MSKPTGDNIRGFQIRGARKMARRYADAEATIWLGVTRTKGERMGLKDFIAEYLGLPWEHRRRRYYRDIMEAAMAAYDLRMEARYRSYLRESAR